MAAKKTPKDRGTELMQEILALIPEDQRASVAGLLGNDQIQTLVGEHTLRQDEASRQFEHNRTVAQQQSQWWLEHKEKLSEYDQLASSGKLAKLVDDDPDDEPEDGPDPKKRRQPAAQPPGITVEQARTELDARELRNAQFSAYMTGLASRHSNEYKKPLDTLELFNFCREKNIQIDRGGYELYTKDLREARDAEALKEREKELRADERRKVTEELAAKGPGYMQPGGGYVDPKSGPASIDEVLMRPAEGKSDSPFTAAAAARSYNTAVLGGGGA